MGNEEETKMYARLNMLKIEPGQREFGEGMADKVAPVLQSLKGFKSVTFIADFEAGDIGGLSVWETLEDADAAGEVMRTKILEIAGDKLIGPPDVKIFEVYEPGN